MKAVRIALTLALLGAVSATAGLRPAPTDAAASRKIPITTASEEARKAYLQGRDLLDTLRAADARAHFARAAELDPNFALAAYGTALAAQAPAEFFPALRRAVALAEAASAGEAHMIRALEAATNGQPDLAREHLIALVAAYPNDERAHTLLGQYHFGRQEWQAAIDEYRTATAINAAYSQPYNQLGYALRFLERWDEAEQVFRAYVELIPREPNPYDSYAELLMKRGRFSESIAQYRKALEIDPTFVASFIGIANDQIFLGDPTAARATLSRFLAVARNDGQRRLAHFWTAVSHLHEGAGTAALGEVERMQAIAVAAKDRVAQAADFALMGTILLEYGQADAALARFEAGLAAIDGSDATQDVKDAAHRNHLANLARVALKRGDATAAAKAADEYRRKVEARKIPFEMWQTHEIAGLVAAARGDHATAVRELEQANRQDPRALFALGRAYAADGNAEAARATLTRAAEFNGLGLNYAFVRTKARALLKA
jgi:tetratricopeptide (TPR) repeat protein